MLGKVFPSPADGALALRFADVTKHYTNTRALADFSLEVRPGEFFGVIGVNGAGKTTLLKSLLDFCSIDSGSIEIFGVPHRLTRARARLAFLPERFNPPFYLTGRDFLRYMFSLHRVAYDAMSVERVFSALDLDIAALSKPARAYSKGMTQKLGLAACLLSGKELLVLDEPASGLDPKARALFKQELARLHEGRRTVFFFLACPGRRRAVVRRAGSGARRATEVRRHARCPATPVRARRRSRAGVSRLHW